MIVRLSGEGQYRVGDDVVQRLNDLDERAQAAVDENDEPELDRRLVRREGESLPEDDLSPSDFVIPPSDLTLEETKRLFSEAGLIPDVPA